MKLLLVLLLAGCTVSHAYTVDPAALACDPVPALRVKDGKPVRLRRDDIVQTDGNRVKTRHKSAMVTAGSILTWVGSAISIAGTVMFLATGNFGGSGAVNTAGLVMAPAAEPLMIAGTVLWVIGLGRTPSEMP